MPRDNICVYMAADQAHVFFMSGGLGNVCCVAGVVEDVGFSLGLVKYVVCLRGENEGCCVYV